MYKKSFLDLVTYTSKAIVCFGLLLVFVGCSKTVKITPLQQELGPPTDPNTIEVLPYESIETGEYDIIAKVFARHKGGILLGKGEDDIQNTLKQNAASLGADAILGFKTSKQDDGRYKSENSRWGSALAVKKREKAGEASTDNHFIVAICGDYSLQFENWKRDQIAEAEEEANRPKQKGVYSNQEDEIKIDTSYESFTKDSVRNNRNWIYVLSAVEYQLEKRGYYPILTSGSEMDITSDSLEYYINNRFDELFGKYISHVVHVDLAKSGSYSAGLFAGASAEVTAKLFSIQEDSYVWENSASKSLFPTFGVLNVLFESGETRQQRAISSAIKELFENLHSITTN